MPGIYRQGPVETLQCVVETPQLLERDGAPAQEIRVIGRKPKGRVERAQRFVGARESQFGDALATPRERQLRLLAQGR